MKKVVVADPREQSKEKNCVEGLEVCKAFLDLNKVSHPEFNLDGIPDKFNASRAFGLYVPSEKSVYIDQVKCLKSTGRPHKGEWSFTGSKSDMSVAGVLAHETGHHVHFELGVKPVSKKLVNVARRELRVSMYEPNILECFAEAARLFILNPDLLRCGRPLRYKFFTKTLGLKPLHEISWREVLRFAHPRIVGGIEGWIKEGTS